MENTIGNSSGRTMACDQCGKFQTVHEEKKDVVIAVKGENITIPNGTVDVCDICGEVMWTQAYDKLTGFAYEFYKKAHKLLTSEDIWQIRNKYGCTQAVFASALGIGSASIHRYETNGIQTPVYDTLIRNASDPEQFLEFLRKNKNNLKPVDYEALKSKIEQVALKEKEEHGNISPLREYINTAMRGELIPACGQKFSMDKFIGVVNMLLTPETYKQVGNFGGAISENMGNSMPEIIDINTLNRLLFFVDWTYYYKHKRTIIGVPYIKTGDSKVAPMNASLLYEYMKERKLIKIFGISFKNSDDDIDCVQNLVANNREELSEDEKEHIFSVLQAMKKNCNIEKCYTWNVGMTPMRDILIRATKKLLKEQPVFQRCPDGEEMRNYPHDRNTEEMPFVLML